MPVNWCRSSLFASSPVKMVLWPVGFGFGDGSVFFSFLFFGGFTAVSVAKGAILRATLTVECVDPVGRTGVI